MQDSPTSKLLYNKEVQGYKAQVRQYYQDVRDLPRVQEETMQNYLRQLSMVKTTPHWDASYLSPPLPLHLPKNFAVHVAINFSEF